MDTAHTFSSESQWLFDYLRGRAERVLASLLRNTPLAVAFGGLALWLLVVRASRWRRYNAIHRKYGPKWNNGLGTINPREAQEIIHLSTVYDMPTLLYHAVSFALFKTYGIPSISKLLVATKELCSKETMSRRYADTEILISTWHTCPISGFADPSISLRNTGPNARPAEDPRANIALARVNYLHSKYKISNSDYLYTLCLFANEPSYWSDRYGWRYLSPLERHAFYVFWAEVGRKMNIQDIPGSLEEMTAFIKEYEEAHMVPAETNREVAGYTLDELLSPVPNALGLKAFATSIVVSVLSDRTREAMMYRKRPWIYRSILNGTLLTAAFIQRFLLLPRYTGYYVVDHKLPNNVDMEHTRMHPTRYAARPWYKPESTSIIGRYTDKLLVKLGFYLEMPSAHLKSDGYRLEEMGPMKFENAGHEEVMQNAAKLQGCPITGPWSLDGRK
ncbi:hypothetical protein BDN70DRAFT_882785 [Pholiota conissans]|uniref:ER-bound oxygenase mpaB/mpaB'/Rubber oxygenase catalytic domain-containing protein n=1 Tax=Pholiota conissans TaxID=109636 RepID=A0A9P5YV08_9AGAR|nr:hypothetical protein BDN70DRAFT_882785 [Pholiota conissans]